MQPKQIDEYTGELTIHQNNQACLVRFQGSSPAIVQDLINSMLGNRGHIKDSEIFSEDQFNGEKPVGWIGTVKVPQPLSVRAAAEHRLELLQKVA